MNYIQQIERRNVLNSKIMFGEIMFLQSRYFDYDEDEDFDDSDDDDDDFITVF